MQNIYVRRRNKLSTGAKNRLIDKSLVFNPSSIFYFTGIKFNPYERVIALIIDSHSEETQLLIPSLEKGIVNDQSIQEISYDDSEEPLNYLTKSLFFAKRIGVDMDYLTLLVSNKLQNSTGVEESLVNFELIDNSKDIQMLRMRKDSEEISLINIATEYTCAIFSELKKYIKVGHSEKEIALEIIKHMWSFSGVISDGIVVQVLSGLNSSNPHGYSGDTRIAKGDPVTIDFGVNYMHYWSDMARTFFVGKPTQKMADIYNIVLEAQLAAIDTVKPGVMVSEVDINARSIIGRAGYGEFFIHRTGHGLGIDIHELPIIHNKNTDVFKEGEVFTIEPGIYVPGLGGVRIEDDVVVTKDGCRVLKEYPKNLVDMIL